LIHNGDVYTAAKPKYKQIVKSGNLYFLVTYFDTAISCIVKLSYMLVLDAVTMCQKHLSFNIITYTLFIVY